MDSTDKKVSIIISCYNQGLYVADAIISALNQTYQNIEIVCINDGSTDNSSEIIKNFANKYNNILFIDNKENNGVINARNTAIDTASGEYILPLDADDTIEPTYVEKAVKILNNNTNIGIVYCEARFFGKKNTKWDLPSFDKSTMLFRNCIFNAAIFRKSDFLRVGKYKEYMKNGLEDYDLWLSFLEENFEVYQIKEALFNYRQIREQTRSDICINNRMPMCKELIQHHINLYLNDKNFIKKIFFTDTDELEKRAKKYKKIFFLLLPIAIVEFLIIIAFVWRYICSL